MSSYMLAIVIASCVFQILAIPIEVEQNDLDFCMCTNNDKSVSIRMLPKNNLTSKDNGTAPNHHPVPKHHQKVRDDYTYTSGVGYHKLHTDATTWNEARKICKEEGGHLAIVNSEAEEQVLVDMLKKNADKIGGTGYKFEALLGIHDMFNEGEWMTVFGDSLENTGYVHWASKFSGVDQPDNDNDKEHCGALLDIGGMNDIECNVKFAFFCEIPHFY